MVDYLVYLGPLARCDIERVAGETTGCINEECRLYHSYTGGTFCSACGKRLSAFSVPNAREKVSDRNLFAKGEPLSSFLTNAGRIFIPNVKRNQPRDFGGDPRDTSWNQEIGPDDIIAELAWFQSAFAEEIERLRQAYGAEHVHVEWTYFSGEF